MGERLMKDGLAEEAIQRIANNIYQHYKTFPKKKFIALATNKLDELELKQRVKHVILALHATLPQPFPKTAQLLKLLPKNWDAGDPNDPIRGFAAWPIIDYVAEFGLEHPKIALKTLETLTPLFSAEFAIRPFIQNHFDLSYEALIKWCDHKDEHVRRLASEGSRPRLPWGIQLPEFIADPKPLLPILEKLKDDPSLYVRRSVANSLNDISKDNPTTTLKLCKKWIKIKNPDVTWVVSHACRTLVKQGHPDSFVLLGYTAKPDVHLKTLKLLKTQLTLGDALEFEVKLDNLKSRQKFVVDYAIHFMKANSKQSAKVFKLKNIDMTDAGVISLAKKHTLKPITTRKYYAGKHDLSIHINGVEVGRKSFQLRID